MAGRFRFGFIWLGLLRTPVPALLLRTVEAGIADRVGGKAGAEDWELKEFNRLPGGEGGIRTHGTRKGTTVFETVPIDHSGTSPTPVGAAL